MLATWPDDRRERWGRLAAVLEAEGMGWRDAERVAFERVSAERPEPAKVAVPPAPVQAGLFGTAARAVESKRRAKLKGD